MVQNPLVSSPTEDSDMWLFLRRVVVAMHIFFLLPLSLSVARAGYCDPGYGSCGDGTCAPLGSVCCGGGKYCGAGNICVKGGKCLRHDAPEVCSNGHSYCDLGSLCIKGNKCLSMESESYCGGRTYCDPGFLCTNDKKCISMASPRYCGNGHYCESGYVCKGQNECQPEAASIPSPQPPSNSGGSGTISDSCLVIGQPRRIGGFIGECDKKDGSKDHFFMTKITSSHATGCPRSIEFTYWDPGDQLQNDWSTPFDVQICGGSPENVHTK